MTRGGKRKAGPGKKMGRPLKTDKRIKTSITLRPDHAELLQGKIISQEIEIALDKHITRGMTMEINFIEKDQDWQNEATRYWFEVDGENFCITDQNGDLSLLDHEGYPLEESLSDYDNKYGNIKDTLISEYEKRIND